MENFLIKIGREIILISLSRKTHENRWAHHLFLKRTWWYFFLTELQCRIIPAKFSLAPRLRPWIKWCFLHETLIYVTCLSYKKKKMATTSSKPPPRCCTHLKYKSVTFCSWQKCLLSILCSSTLHLQSSSRLKTVEKLNEQLYQEWSPLMSCNETVHAPHIKISRKCCSRWRNHNIK